MFVFEALLERGCVSNMHPINALSLTYLYVRSSSSSADVRCGVQEQITYMHHMCVSLGYVMERISTRVLYHSLVCWVILQQC
jgi:hypothetical protein